MSAGNDGLRRVTLQLVTLSGDNVFLLLLLIAMLAFVLGIGLPTVSVYILTATLLAPALVKLGASLVRCHHPIEQPHPYRGEAS